MGNLPASEEREGLNRLKPESFELRRANEILKTASVSFTTERYVDRLE